MIPLPAALVTTLLAAGPAAPATLPAPELAAIGSFVVVYDERDVHAGSIRDPALASPAGEPKPRLREVELALRAEPVPGARAELFLSFGEAGVEIEEGHLATLWRPARLELRAGKLRSPFGRHNPLHRHQWDFADAPLAHARLLGPLGLAGAGVDLSWLAPLPWHAALHVAWQDLRPPFETAERSTALVRLAQRVDLAGRATAGLGLSGATDSARMGDARVLSGADVSLDLRGAREAVLSLEVEAVARNLGASGGGDEWGFHCQAVWRAGARWLAGLRYDEAAASDGGRERRWSLLGGFLPSAHQRLRAQLAEDRLPGGRRGLEAIVQLEFALGELAGHGLR